MATAGDMREQVVQHAIRGGCTVCARSATKTCTGCSIARYCSRRCQGTDCKLHQVICKDFSSLPDYPCDGWPHTLAIAFPCDGESPDLCWIDDGEDVIERRLRRNSTEEPVMLARPRCPKSVPLCKAQVVSFASGTATSLSQTVPLPIEVFTRPSAIARQRMCWDQSLSALVTATIACM